MAWMPLTHQHLHTEHFMWHIWCWCWEQRSHLHLSLRVMRRLLKHPPPPKVTHDYSLTSGVYPSSPRSPCTSYTIINNLTGLETSVALREEKQVELFSSCLWTFRRNKHPSESRRRHALFLKGYWNKRKNLSHREPRAAINNIQAVFRAQMSEEICREAWIHPLASTCGCEWALAGHWRTDGASHAALPTIDMQGGESGTHRDAQSAARYQQWQTITCRSLVVGHFRPSSQRGKVGCWKGVKNCARVGQGYPFLPEEVSVWRSFRHTPSQLIKNWSHSTLACQDRREEKKTQ